MTTSAKSDNLPCKSFLDTSAVYKLQIGASAHIEHLAAAIPKKWYVNNYVKMEYYRSCLMHWIALYFESEHPMHRTFGDTLKYYADKFGREAKTALNAVASIELEGFSFASPEDKEYCRQKLQDFIFEMALQFDLTFADMGKDPTKCSRVRCPIELPEASERDTMLVKVLLVFSDNKECRSRCQIDQLFEREPYKTMMDKIAAIPRQGKVKDALERIVNTIAIARGDSAGITCHSCGRIGDAVIASLLDPAWKLHSMDAVHGPISEAIGLQYQIHPSLAALKNAATSTPASAPLT